MRLSFPIICIGGLCCRCATWDRHFPWTRSARRSRIWGRTRGAGVSGSGIRGWRQGPRACRTGGSGPSACGGDGTPPKLSHLTGSGWAHAVTRTRENVQEVAAQLATLYAEREALRGHAYGEDTPRQRELEASFPYTETPDQLAAIADIKRDLQPPRPMDPLLVGDVGYGKTEVAVRAAFKVVQEGRQVVVLCPTSVLAAQHLKTFLGRLAPFGVCVALLSRFVSATEQQEVLADLKQGAI